MPVSSWNLIDYNGLRCYELTCDRVRLVLTTRLGGVSAAPYANLNLSFEVGDSPENVSENWSRLRALFRQPIVTLKQTHSTTVLPIMYEHTPAELFEGDACFTGPDGPALGIKVADCLPVYLFAADGSCRGIAHCGWRGTAGRIAEKLCRIVARRFSLSLTDLVFSLGPCICSRCYNVGDDVREQIVAAHPLADRLLVPTPGTTRPTWQLDLRAANRWLLREMGLREIAGLDLCTRENPDLFYSVRRNRRTGRNLAFICSV